MAEAGNGRGLSVAMQPQLWRVAQATPVQKRSAPEGACWNRWPARWGKKAGRQAKKAQPGGKFRTRRMGSRSRSTGGSALHLRQPALIGHAVVVLALPV